VISPTHSFECYVLGYSKDNITMNEKRNIKPQTNIKYRSCDSIRILHSLYICMSSIKTIHVYTYLNKRKGYMSNKSNDMFEFLNIYIIRVEEYM
jgi:hypothetical protein